MDDKLDPASVAEIARRQHGVISLIQLRALGLSSTVVCDRRGSGWLHPIHRGVYAVGHTRLTLRGRWMAAVLAAGPGAALSHRDAAGLWNLRPTQPSGDIHVIIPTRAGRAKRPGIAVHRSTTLTHEQTTTRDGIPVTSLVRTLFDLATTRPRQELAYAIHEADHQRLFDLRELTLLMAANPNSRGAKRLDQAIAAYRPEEGVTRRELERRFYALCVNEGLPRPRCNAWIAFEEGGGFRPDFSWPANNLAVEVDGWQSHGTRRAFHSDRRRDRRALVRGRPTVRFTWLEVSESPRQVAAELRRLLAAHTS
jgi:hypothetical protein